MSPILGVYLGAPSILDSKSSTLDVQWNSGNEPPMLKPESVVLFVSSILMDPGKGPDAREKERHCYH